MTTHVRWDSQTQSNLDEWLSGDYDQATTDEIRRLIKEDPKEISDAFYTKLGFGTAGLRGIMGVGPNRMNAYTVQAATQGLANYLKKRIKGECKVLIGYDSRNYSHAFAMQTAQVLAGNGIGVRIYRDIRPVPMVSFGCVELGCHAAVMITASHNPPQYNGYKVYWSHGGQVLPPHDQGIIEEVNNIDSLSQIRVAPLEHPNIQWIGEELDQAYLNKTRSLQALEGQNREYGHALKVVYTALHGTGITMVPKSLKDWGFTQVLGVEKQNHPHGDFPTIKTPNPEEHDSMRMGIDLLQESASDLLLGTDADADRLGVVVMHHQKPVFLDGNQIASLCLHHVLSSLHAEGRLPKRSAVIKTIVTSELFHAIAQSYDCVCFDVLTGFKYIGELISAWESDPKSGYHYVFGAEESYGSLLGTHARDKDAIIACSLVCELALDAKLRGKTLVDCLDDLYRQYGVYRERLASVTYSGKEGAEKMGRVMSDLRNNPPQSIGGIAVQTLEDYLTGTQLLIQSQHKKPLTLPRSNVLRFWLADGSKVVVRPSGTEPKIKLYLAVHAKASKNLQETVIACDHLTQALLDHFLKLM